MPKIPTFTAETRPTAEVSSLTMDLKLSPTATPAASLLPAAQAIDEYYIKQRDNIEKLEAKKVFYEMKIESDKIQTSQKNNPDEFNSINIYSQKFNEYKKQKLSQINNKRIKQKLELLLDSDQSETIYNIKTNSFKAFEEQNLSRYNTEQNTLASEYSLTDDSKIKATKKQSRINSAIEFESMHNMGKPWLDKEIQIINTDSVIFDADKAVANKNYSQAKQILLNAKNVDNEEIQKILITIEKENVEYLETSFHVNNLMAGKNSLINSDLKNTNEKKIIQDFENKLISTASQNNFEPEKTFAYLDEKFSITGMVSPRYKDLLEAGYNSGSTTTFDSLADIPEILIESVKVAEIANNLGRLNVYTNDDEERFFKNIIVLKKIKGLDDFQAITTAKNFEMNYDKQIMSSAQKNKTKTLTKINTEYVKIKTSNIGEVLSYGETLYNIYTANGISGTKAQTQVIEDLKNNIQIIDGRAYLKRDVNAFASIGGIDNVKPIKEYIIKNNLTDEDPDDYYLKHNGAGQFEIRREVDFSPVYNNKNEVMIFYPIDLFKISKQIELEQKELIEKETIEKQEKLQLQNEEAEKTIRWG